GPGRGFGAVDVAAPNRSASREPSPQPSPGVPGEGKEGWVSRSAAGVMPRRHFPRNRRLRAGVAAPLERGRINYALEQGGKPALLLVHLLDDPVHRFGIVIFYTPPQRICEQLLGEAAVEVEPVLIAQD